MNEEFKDEIVLQPCPFCGAGMTHESETISPPTKVKPEGQFMGWTIKHWCDKLPGVSQGYFEIRATHRKAAARQWNKRS